MIAMEENTLTFVILAGLCFLPACFPKMYIVAEKPMSWAEAQSYCREKYTDLASVANKEESDKLLVAAQKYFTGILWIGLYDDINSWRWSLEQDGYYGEGEAEFKMWNSGEPNNNERYGNCAEMDNGFWNDEHCEKRRQFACYNETVTSSSFIIVTEPKTWKEAQSHCRKHHTDLASVRNQAENDQITQMTQNQTTWIGLYRDSWKWSDGSPTSFKNWNTDNTQPNTACAMLQNGQWKSRDCQKTFFSVCHFEPVKVVTVKVTVKDSSGNLEDAAEAILQQLSQTLKDRSLGNDTKLTWRKKPDGRIFHLEEKEEQEEQLQC